MMNPNKGNSTLNTLLTMIDNAVSRVFTALPVRVLSVNQDKRLVDVMPMVHMLDNDGQAVEHAQISNIPYLRQQAGDYGIIIDPKVGDKGLAVFAGRDISNIVTTRDTNIPASLRKHSISDGIYMGSLLNEEPRTWLKITDGRLNMAIAPNAKADPTTFLDIQDQDVKLVLAPASGDETHIKVRSGDIEITSAQVTINGNVNINGNVTIAGEEHSITAQATNTIQGLTNTIQGTDNNITGITAITGDTTIQGVTEIIGATTIDGAAVVTGDAEIIGFSFKGHVHGNGNKGSDTSPPK